MDDDRLWDLIRRTGGLIDDDGLVQVCYDMLGLDRDDDDEIISGEGPTADDYPSSSSSTSEDDSAP